MKAFGTKAPIAQSAVPISMCWADPPSAVRPIKDGFANRVSKLFPSDGVVLQLEIGCS